MATSDKVHMDPFPVGAVFFSAVNTNPSTLLGYGTWSLIGNGRMIMGAASTDKGLETGGSMSKSVPLLAHTHTGPSHTHTTPNHTHTTGNNSVGHTHGVGAHTHPYGAKFMGFTTSDNPSWLYFNAVSFGGTTATGNSTAFNTGGISANHTHSIASSGGGTSGASGTGNTGSTGTANVTMDVTNSYIKLFIWQRTA